MFILPISLVVLIILSVAVNALLQCVFKDTNKPPLVFHYFPIIGSTITYGKDPLKFFEDCKQKVCSLLLYPFPASS